MNDLALPIQHLENANNVRALAEAPVDRWPRLQDLQLGAEEVLLLLHLALEHARLAAQTEHLADAAVRRRGTRQGCG